MEIKVACVTDLDVMPACARQITGKDLKTKIELGEAKIAEKRELLKAKASGQSVRTFVADEWTLEYDLSLGPRDANGDFSCVLAEDVFIAACLALKDDPINSRTVKVADVESQAASEFTRIRTDATPRDGCTAQEVLASFVYAKFTRGGASKPIFAQYLAQRLQTRFDLGQLTSEYLRSVLPTYLVEAIDYVTQPIEIVTRGMPTDE